MLVKKIDLRISKPQGGDVKYLPTFRSYGAFPSIYAPTELISIIKLY